MRAQLNDVILPKHLGHLEAVLAAVGGSEPWLAGTVEPTGADVLFAVRLCWMLHENNGVDSKLLEGFPLVRATVRAHRKR